MNVRQFIEKLKLENPEATVYAPLPNDREGTVDMVEIMADQVCGFEFPAEGKIIKGVYVDGANVIDIIEEEEPDETEQDAGDEDLD